MLSTERYSQADKSWEDLPKKEKVWTAWKNIYKATERKARVKKKSLGDQDQFGATHNALRQAPEPEQKNQATSPNRLVTDLDEYFGALAAAAST